MRQWLPADHLVWFLLETLQALDTSAFHSRRRLGGVAPLNARRLAPGDDTPTVTAGQLRAVVQRLIVAGQWR
jgi:hypothetical protein